MSKKGAQVKFQNNNIIDNRREKRWIYKLPWDNRGSDNLIELLINLYEEGEKPKFPTE